MYFGANNNEIYYQDYGEKHNPAIVFLHGVGMDHRTFLEQATAFESSFRVIILDLPGHGKSSNIDEYNKFSETSAKSIIELLDSLEIKRAVMVGQSLGSFVVQRIAEQDPDRVIASVHLGGGSLYPGYPAIIKAFKPFTSLTMLLVPENFLYKKFALHKALKVDTQEYLEEITSANGKNLIKHLTLEMFNDMSDGLSKPLDHDMLILYGDHDLNFIKKLSIKWHNSHNRSDLVEIENAHHIANQDNPWKFNMVLKSFLQSIDLNREQGII